MHRSRSTETRQRSRGERTASPAAASKGRIGVGGRVEWAFSSSSTVVFGFGFANTSQLCAPARKQTQSRRPIAAFGQKIAAPRLLEVGAPNGGRSKIGGDSFRLGAGAARSASAARFCPCALRGIARGAKHVSPAATFNLRLPFCLVGAARRARRHAGRRPRSGTFDLGGDAEGGGPYVYPDPASPRTVVGFEVDLAKALAAEIGVTAQFFQAPWDDLPSLLETGQIDVILNGYELTPARTARMASTSPYYVYRLALLVPHDGSPIVDWDSLHHPRPGRPWRVGTLVSSGAYLYLRQHYDGDVELIGYKANTDAMREVENDKLDATVVDLPMVTFFEDQYPGLRASRHSRPRPGITSLTSASKTSRCATRSTRPWRGCWPMADCGKSTSATICGTTISNNSRPWPEKRPWSSACGRPACRAGRCSSSADRSWCVRPA